MAVMAVAMAVALFGVYRNLTSPFGVFGLPPLVQPAVDTALETRLREKLELADARVRGFRLAQGRMPSSMDDLVAEGLATRASIEGVELTVSARGYRLQLPGPAGAVAIERTFAVREPPPPPPASPTPTPKK